MRIEKVLHTNLLDPVPGLHAKRAGALTAMVSSLVHGAFLTVTSLGRRLQSPAKTKHNIKRADRTLSNKALQRDRLSIYRTLCARLCGHLKHPVILVDWSDIAEQERLLVIRAALVVDGRALPLYEEVYALKHYSKPRIHREFLNTLKSLLPAHCIRGLLLSEKSLYFVLPKQRGLVVPASQRLRRLYSKLRLENSPSL